MKEDICIKVFGDFDILCNGKSIFNRKKNSVKIIQLLKYFMIHEGKFIPPETIVEQLWPNNEYEDEKAIVKACVHRLRQFLKIDNSVKVDLSELLKIQNVRKGYGIIVSKEVQNDKNEFNRICEEISNCLSTSENVQQLCLLFRQLTEVYQGEFMNGTQQEEMWLERYQNYYTRVFCTIVNSVLKLLHQKNEFEVMVDICEKSLSIYNLEEDINVYFLIALLEQNKIEQAWEHYECVCKTFEENNMVPSTKLKTISDRIRSEQYKESVTDREYEKIRYSVEKAVEKVVQNQNDHFSICYIEVEYTRGFNRKMDHLIVEHVLKKALTTSLRTEDMYAIVNENYAIAAIRETNERIYDSICKRIYSMFYDEVATDKYRLNINLFGLRCIV